MLREIDAGEADGGLDGLLDLVEQGEVVVITRAGKPVARVTRVAPVKDRSAAIAAAKAVVEMTKGVTLGGHNIEDMINEGRP